VNVHFARTIARSLKREDRVWVHDFHLFPLGAELRRRGFLGPLGFFLHTPFPSPPVFANLPWAGELLRDLVAYDLAGFQTQACFDSYERAVADELGDSSGQRAGVYPVGIDPAPYVTWALEPAGKRRAKELRASLGERRLVLSVDRLDYTKGIIHRLRAIERFFELFPDRRGRVSMLQISAPTRTRMAEYGRARREVEALVGHVNGRFGEPDWVPVRYIFRAFTQRELASFYREADVGLVTPLRDGMSLVAKEFVASQVADPGVLVLSKFAGAAAELDQALLVNPHDADGMARALARALDMPLAERIARQSALLARVREGTAAKWGDGFLADLEAVRGAPVEAATERVAP
jgi:trehalose 6-phosphate synthase